MLSAYSPQLLPNVNNTVKQFATNNSKVDFDDELDKNMSDIRLFLLS